MNFGPACPPSATISPLCLDFEDGVIPSIAKCHYDTVGIHLNYTVSLRLMRNTGFE